VLSADGTLWRLVESKGASSLGGYRIQGVIEEESHSLLASVASKVGEGETARLAKEAMERAREEARRLGLPTKGLLLRTDGAQHSSLRSFVTTSPSTVSDRSLPRWESPRGLARLSDCIGA